MVTQPVNPLNDIAEAGEELLHKVEDEPVEVHSELKKMIKPAIKVGQQQGMSTKPEKRLYKKLKNIEPVDEPDKLEKAIEEWVDERGN